MYSCRGKKLASNGLINLNLTYAPPEPAPLDHLTHLTLTGIITGIIFWLKHYCHCIIHLIITRGNYIFSIGTSTPEGQKRK